MERSLYLSATCRQRYCIFQHRLAVHTSVISHRQLCLSVTYHAWVTPSCLVLLHACQDGWLRAEALRLFVQSGRNWFASVPCAITITYERCVRMRVHWSCGEIEPGDIPPRSLLARFMVHFPAERVDLSVRLATADTITAQTQNNHWPYMTAG